MCNKNLELDINELISLWKAYKSVNETEKESAFRQYYKKLYELSSETDMNMENIVMHTKQQD